VSEGGTLKLRILTESSLAWEESRSSLTTTASKLDFFIKLQLRDISSAGKVEMEGKK